MSKLKIAGSECLIKCLINENVKTIFGYPGGAIMPVYDSLYKYQDKINHVLTRHEQGAVHAAQGFYRISGETGVAIATSGPGATNLITGIADANIDSTAIVCITGQVPSYLLGSDAFQEVDIMSLTTAITKWSYQITKAEEIPNIIAKAFYIAKSGRPGPVLIDITKNAQIEEIEYSYSKIESIRSYFPYPKIELDQIKKAAESINNAKRPFVIFGQGVILGNAEQEFLSFIEKSGIPSAWTILGASAIPTDHPLAVGMLGMHGNYAPNILTNECDLLIAIGMRFDDRVTSKLESYAKQATIIHFDIDSSEINKNIIADLTVLGDCKRTLKEIMPYINNNKHEEWLNEFKKLDKIEYDKVIKNDLFPGKEEKISMGEVIHKINHFTKGDHVCVTDVGQHQMVALRYTKSNNSRSHITSGGLGTMGFALPAAIGAKIACPEKQVIAIIGDGGYQMCIQELGTIVQTNAAVKIVVLNNNFLGMVRQWQELFFEKRYSHTHMENPDFIKIAEGYNITSKRVEKNDRTNLDNSIKEMLSHNGPYFLEIVVKKEGNVFPMVPSGASISEIRLS